MTLAFGVQGPIVVEVLALHESEELEDRCGTLQAPFRPGDVEVVVDEGSDVDGGRKARTDGEERVLPLYCVCRNLTPCAAVKAGDGLVDRPQTVKWRVAMEGAALGCEAA